MTDLIHPDPGGQIAEPGAYRMDMDRYHDAHVCIGPSVSSSGLRTIESQGTARFWAFSGLNPSRFEKPPSDALSFGKAAHALLLGDEDFDAGYVVLPKDAPPPPTQAMLNAVKPTPASLARQEFWAGFEKKQAGRVIVPEVDLEHIQHMAESLHRAELPDIIFGGEPEVSLIWQDVTGIWVKARPDALPQTGDLGDLKTTSEATHRFTDRQIADHGYHMQMALCVEGMERVLGRRPTGVILIFVEKKPPYQVIMRPISEDALYWGRMQNRRALNAMAACLESGDWGEEPGNLSEFNLPTWLHDRLSAEQSDGRLPNDDDVDEEEGDDGQEDD